MERRNLGRFRIICLPIRSKLTLSRLASVNIFYIVSEHAGKEGPAALLLDLGK